MLFCSESCIHEQVNVLTRTFLLALEIFYEFDVELLGESLKCFTVLFFSHDFKEILVGKHAFGEQWEFIKNGVLSRVGTIGKIL